ncbi:MAG: RES family NAD+ phosphorylase [Mycobacterium sp.]
MSHPRQQRALGNPPADLAGFPRWRLKPNYVLRRAHRAGYSPWWFSSDLSGRFDLISPFGTCYLATDITTALRERFGHELVNQGTVTFTTAAQTHVSALVVPAGRWVADCCHDDAATFGLTRELGTCANYDIPQGWAMALHRERLHGLRYQTRFTTGPRPNAVALFDDAGLHDWPVDPDPLGGVKACTDAGIDVADIPTRGQLRIIKPPNNK